MCCATTTGLVEGVGEARAGHLEADLGHGLLEPLAVLGRLDGVGPRPDDLDPVGLEDAGGGERHREVERGLPTERRQQRVGALALDDGGQHVDVEGLDVGAVGHSGVGHDRGRVGVGEDHPEPLLAQHAAGLGARVVELAGLADHDGPRADHEDRLEVVAARHSASPGGGPGVEQREEVGEQRVCVVGSGARLGVELDAERVGPGAADALDHAVVQVAVRHL